MKRYLLILVLLPLIALAMVENPTFLASLSPTVSGCIFYANGNNATESISGSPMTVNGSVTYTTGKVGNAFTFAAITDWLDFGTDVSLTNLTVEMWLWVDASTYDQWYGQTYFFSVSKGPDNGGDWISSFLRLSDQKLSPDLNWNGSSLNHIFDPTWPHDQWFHIAFVFSSDESINLYYNGTNAGATTFSALSSPFLNATNITINSLKNYVNYSPSQGTRGIIGKIDEFAIYHRVLSPSEILSIYNAENAGLSVTRTP